MTPLQYRVTTGLQKKEQNQGTVYYYIYTTHLGLDIVYLNLEVKWCALITGMGSVKLQVDTS